MAEFRSLGDRSSRPPTSAELVRLAELREAGIADVYLEPEEAPPEFWENLVQATFHLLSRPPRFALAALSGQTSPQGVIIPGAIEDN
jgi:hypothetical protein